MLAIFASVGASRFDLTFTDACGRKVGFRPGLTLDALRPALGQMLRDAASLQHNVIVRPRSPRTTLVQLDDLDAAATDRVKQASFLVICTSPGSYQAWVAVDDPDADFARRLRRGAGADPAASGATRISGSLNFKAKYEPGFPQVQTVCTHPGLVMTQAQLEALDIATDEKPTAISYGSPTRKPGFEVSMVRDGSGDNSYWTGVGNAWRQEGYVSIQLEVVPTGGKLILTQPKERQ